MTTILVETAGVSDVLEPRLVNLMERHPKITGTAAVIAGAAALGVLFIA